MDPQPGSIYARAVHFSCSNVPGLMISSVCSGGYKGVALMMRPRAVTTLGAGGAWLVALGGSFYYVIAGIGFLVTGTLLIVKRGAALWAANSTGSLHRG